MKGKNSIGGKEPRSFALEESFLSYKEHRIIFFISVIVALCGWFFLIFLEFKKPLTIAQENTLFAFFVLREVIMVCVFALMPVFLVLYLILTHVLKKKIQQLNEILLQRGQTTNQQSHPAKIDRENISCFFITFLCFIILLEVSFTAGVVMLILEFYSFFFKRVRLYCNVKRELKHVKSQGLSPLS
ncbi:hypothetical protein MNL01_07300 [Bartonella krasnovii]|uniref:hypothetical protein n=1 Tax=Bartonella krasnovii TaxID=2267275 RepID=UPI001F4D0494|nr:hypothetical protein [Bartonella krasnovii]UNF41920.1 hypothetical protein MNL08_07080 [Bartonella krasnovii]UNF53433.1 hypothetical protein MNL01_07300 [Bartonella krasnovii]UNF55126.1 hypothetical protein MNL00_07095 [Bartonella krasnovii]